MTHTEYLYSHTQDECKAIFVSSCIECTVTAFSITAEIMSRRMHKIGIIENYILLCYGILHAESRQNITDDIVKTTNIREKEKVFKNDYCVPRRNHESIIIP